MHSANRAPLISAAYDVSQPAASEVVADLVEDVIATRPEAHRADRSGVRREFFAISIGAGRSALCSQRARLPEGHF